MRSTPVRNARCRPCVPHGNCAQGVMGGLYAVSPRHLRAAAPAHIQRPKISRGPMSTGLTRRLRQCSNRVAEGETRSRGALPRMITACTARTYGGARGPGDVFRHPSFSVCDSPGVLHGLRASSTHGYVWYNVLVMLTFPADLTRSAALIHRQDAATRPPLVTLLPCQAGDTVGMVFIHTH